VVHQIEQLVGGTSYFSLDSGRVSGTAPPESLAFADFAVLYRLSAQSRLLVEALERSGIPYQVARQTDDYDPRADRVALMTLHAAKGLEFPVVFIVGCEEGLLPYLRASHIPGMVSMGNIPDAPANQLSMADSPSSVVDEERRLFYVGLTRAERKLVLTSTRRRFLFGQSMENLPSRFVAGIEAALKEVHEMAQRPASDRPEAHQLSLF
jgi:DNA helicase-2/ATP-dependent DNA helicase PcrA